MAETRLTEPFNVDFSGRASEKRPAYRRLCTINGLLIGLAFGLGAWGLEAIRMARLPVESYLPALLLGITAVTVLCGFVGWITGRIDRAPVTVIFWAATAVIGMLILGYLPYHGRTIAAWLADSRFWGRDVFPYALEGRPAGMILGGLLIILALTLLGLLQNYRMGNIASEVNERGRLNSRAWISLLLPLPLVFLAALVTQSVLTNPSAAAVEVVHHAVSVAREYEGDLRTLDLGDGNSYAALAQVQDQIGGDYTLSLVDMNPLNSTVIVGVNFAGGEWIYCRVINDQLSFCYDAAPAYTLGLHSLITGDPLPEDCRGCGLEVTEEAAAWLAGHRGRLGNDLAIERVAQQGSHTLMRVTDDDGQTIECWIEGVTPPQLMECREIVR